MNRIKYLGLLALLFLSVNEVLAGGGWPQAKGSGYIKLAEWWVISNQHYTDNGLIDPNVTTGLFNTTLYAEYGFTDRFTGILYMPLFSRTYFNNTISSTTGEVIAPGEAINSIGDADITLKYGLITNKKIVLSASLTLGIPLGESAGGSLGTLQTGDGEFNQMIQLDASTSWQWGSFNMYGSIYGAYNNRTNSFSDEIRFGAEVGVTFWENRITAIARLYGISSLKNGESIEPGNATSIFANNTEFVSFSPELNYNFNENFGVSASYGIAFSGKLIFANPSYSVGAYYKW
ncbi:MAG: hypothetical protein DHS20C18_25280 [Saprospiraceae bacterium]|nr:MAG: hypothetical protein DHS20C18_25280 [Saprospiraceae bacterium]